MKTQSLIRFISCVVMTACLAAGCVQQEPPAPAKERARDYLNHGQYDAAIGVLENVRTVDPNDHEAALLLASAYAGSVGFNVVDASDIFQSIAFQQDRPSMGLRDDLNTPDVANEIGEQGLNEKDLEGLLLQFLDETARSLRIAQMIPTVSAEQRSRLVESFLVLRTIPKDSPLYIRARSYAALMSILQFFNSLRDAVRPDPTSSRDARMICTVKVSALLASMESAVRYLGFAVDDVTEVVLALGQAEPPRGLRNLHEHGKRLEATYQTRRVDLESAQVLGQVIESPACL